VSDIEAWSNASQGVQFGDGLGVRMGCSKLIFSLPVSGAIS